MDEESLTVDRDACLGSGMCAATAPERAAGGSVGTAMTFGPLAPPRSA
jgi:ferredoxin